MSQTSYDLNQPVAYAGMKLDSRFDTVESYAAEEAIPFGVGVVAGTDPLVQVKIPTADTDTFRGISLQTHKEQLSNGTVQYNQSDAVSTLREGGAYVEASVAVTVDEPAYVVASGGDAGKFTNVSTSNIGPVGVFKGTIAAAGIVPVEINLP